MKKDDLDVIGVPLIVISAFLFIYYSTFGNCGSLFFGFFFGIISIALFELSEKINREKSILSVMLLLISTSATMIKTSWVITVIIIIVCSAGIFLFVIISPKNKKKPAPNSTAEQ